MSREDMGQVEAKIEGQVEERLKEIVTGRLSRDRDMESRNI